MKPKNKALLKKEEKKDNELKNLAADHQDLLNEINFIPV